MKKFIVGMLFLITAMSLFSAVTFDVETLDFGEVSVGQDSVLTVIVTSEIDQDITLTTPDLPFELSPATFHLGENETQEVEITFTPTVQGSFSDSTTASGSVYGSDTITISGVGISPEIETNISSYDFGAVPIAEPDSVTVTISNTGTGTLACTLAFDNTHFTLSESAVDVNASSTADFTVYFTPTLIPQETGTLTISSNDVDEPTIELTFTGTGVSEVGGEVSGTWTLANSPYFISENVTVPAGQTLTIEPGVEVIFANPLPLSIKGTLIANGTAEQKIYFHGANNIKQGVIVFDTEESEPLLEHCIVENMNAGQFFYDDFEDGLWDDVWSGSGNVYNSTSFPYEGSRSLVIYSNGSDAYAQTDAIVSGETCIISCYFRVISSGNNCNTNFYWRKNNGNWTLLYYTNSHHTYDWTYKEWDISSSVSAGDAIQFKVLSSQYSNYSDPQGTCIDNVQISSGKGAITSKGDITLTNSQVTDNAGNGVYADGDITLTNSQITDNAGNGVYADGDITITNSQVTENAEDGIYASGTVTLAQSFITANTGKGIVTNGAIAMNYSVVAYNGLQGLYISGDNFSTIDNSILYHNDDTNHQQIYASAGIVNSSYSDVQGLSSFGISETGQFVWGAGCIESNPVFTDQLGTLSVNSPCVDAASPWEHDANMPFGLGTVVADMGVYGGPGNAVWGGTPVPNGDPVISNIFDLPQDQGGFVGIQYNGSIFDYGHTGYEITHYSFWRAMEDRRGSSHQNLTPALSYEKSENLASTLGGIEKGQIKTAPQPSPKQARELLPTFRGTKGVKKETSSTRRGSKLPTFRGIEGVQKPRQFTRDGEYWEFVGEMDAQGFENYGFTAPTLADSNSYGMYWSKYIVIAHTPDDAIYFTSEPDSGYSVDNINPIQPNRIDSNGENGEITLDWSPSTSEDLHFYKICRGVESGVYDQEFSTSDTIFIDTTAEVETDYFYCLKAVDENGNESEGEEIQTALNYSNYNLHSGANLVSFRFIDEDNSPAGMFAPLGLNIAKIIGEEEVASQVSESVWQGNLNEISYEKGYWLIMNEADQLELMGPRSAEEPVYNLHQNANLISYPQAIDNEISAAIPDEIESHFMAIIGEGKAALHLENGDWVGNLTHFAKEKGYWVIVDADVVLDFEEADGTKTPEKEDLEVPEFFAFNQSALQAFFITGKIYIHGNELTEDDWIAAYDNDVCIGASNYIGANTTIPAMGNDGNAYSANYAENNDEIYFKVWDASAESFFTCDQSVIWESGEIEQTALNSFTSNGEDAIIPLVNSLSQNYPNPFNPTTTISFGLKSDSNVKIDIFNMKGQKVETIFNGHKNAGYHSINFVANQYSSGVYFYKISADGFVKIKKMVLLK